MSEREPQDGHPTQPVDRAAGLGEPEKVRSESRESGSPSPATWAELSSSNLPPQAPPWAGSSVTRQPAGLGDGVPETDPSGLAVPPAPGGPGAGRTASLGESGGRRRALLVAGGAGAALLLIGAGFLAGTQFGSGGSDQTRLISAQGGPQAYDGDQFGRGPFGAGAGMDAGQGVAPGTGQGDGSPPLSIVAAGTVTAVKGSTLTLSTRQGATVIVATSKTTTVAGRSGGDLSSLAVGQMVLVSGTKNTDGSYQATAILTRPGRLGDGSGTGPGSLGGAMRDDGVSDGGDSSQSDGSGTT